MKVGKTNASWSAETSTVDETKSPRAVLLRQSQDTLEQRSTALAGPADWKPENLLSNMGNLLRTCGKDLDWHVRLKGSQLALGWAREQKSLFWRLHDLPSPAWIEDFVSASVTRRVTAYHIYNDALNSPDEEIGRNAALIGPQGVWERVSGLLIDDPTSPTALISARCVIYRVLGDIGPTDALKKAREGLETLKEENQQRKYTGPILSRYHNGFIDSSGEEYESERKLIQGHVKHVRWVFECLVKCLEEQTVRANIFSVPDKYFRHEFPEVVLLKNGTDQKPSAPKTLFAGFYERHTGNQNTGEALSNGDFEEYELVDLLATVKKN